MTKILHIQPALPLYRLDFFNRLSALYGPSMTVAYSLGSLGELTPPVSEAWAFAVGPIRQLPGGMMWQSGVVGLAVQPGDIVVLSGNPRLLSTMALLVRAKLCGARVVWWGHYWSSTSRRWRQILRLMLMSNVDAILLYTDEEVAKIHSDMFLFRKGCQVAALNNGIDIGPIRRLRRPYSAMDRDQALVFIGRLTEKAGLALGLEALALLGNRAPELHVIGDGEMRESLQTRARDLGLGGRIFWYGAITNEADIAKIANRCRAFFYPGEVGLSLIHAMAYGLPAILHDEYRSHMPEIAAFRDRETGLSFRHGDARSLAESIMALLADDASLQRFSVTATEVVGPSYTTQDMAERFIALVEKLESST